MTDPHVENERRITTIIERLASRTTKGLIRWEQGDDGSFTFRPDGANCIIVVRDDHIDFMVHWRGGGHSIKGEKDSDLIVGDTWPHEGIHEQRWAICSLKDALRYYPERHAEQVRLLVGEMIAHLDALEAGDEK